MSKRIFTGSWVWNTRIECRYPGKAQVPARVIGKLIALRQAEEELQIAQHALILALRETDEEFGWACGRAVLKDTGNGDR